MSFKLGSDESGNLYPMNEGMPCGPQQIQIWNWGLPNTLGRMEREEAAARLLVFSILAGEWVGVSYARIGEMCAADIELREVAMLIDRTNLAEANRVAKANKNRFWYNLLTFGWYGRNRPVEAARVLDLPTLPMTGIYLFGSRHIVTGFQELRDGGLVRIENVDGKDIIFPTPKLLRRIMEVQRIAA